MVKISQIFCFEPFPKDKKNYMKNAKVGKNLQCIYWKISMSRNFQIVLIGTKCDLKEDNEALEKMRRAHGPEAKPISKEEGDTLAKQIKAFFFFRAHFHG